MPGAGVASPATIGVLGGVGVGVGTAEDGLELPPPPHALKPASATTHVKTADKTRRKRFAFRRAAGACAPLGCQ